LRIGLAVTVPARAIAVDLTGPNGSAGISWYRRAMRDARIDGFRKALRHELVHRVVLKRGRRRRGYLQGELLRKDHLPGALRSAPARLRDATEWATELLPHRPADDHNIWSVRSRYSAFSTSSVLSFGSAGSLLSVGSILSIGSAGSILSIGSTGSILSIGSIGSVLAVGSAGRNNATRQSTPAVSANAAALFVQRTATAAAAAAIVAGAMSA